MDGGRNRFAPVRLDGGCFQQPRNEAQIRAQSSCRYRASGRRRHPTGQAVSSRGLLVHPRPDALRTGGAGDCGRLYGVHEVFEAVATIGPARVGQPDSHWERPPVYWQDEAIIFSVLTRKAAARVGSFAMLSLAMLSVAIVSFRIESLPMASGASAAVPVTVTLWPTCSPRSIDWLEMMSLVVSMLPLPIESLDIAS